MKTDLPTGKKVEPIIARHGRFFRNATGDWNKLKAKTKEIESYAEVVEGLFADAIKADKKLREMLLDAYKMAPEIDCLFYDSPISPSRHTLYLRAFLKKLGFDGIRDVHTNESDILPFAETIKDGCRWLLKFNQK